MILVSWQQSANSTQTAEQPKPVIQRDDLSSLFASLLYFAYLTAAGSGKAFCKEISFFYSGVQ